MLLTLVFLTAFLDAQVSEQVDLTTIGRDSRWMVVNRTATVLEVQGKRGVKLSEGPGIGIAWHTGTDFSNGIIDVDILGRSQPVQGSFVGVALRVVDGKMHDAVYFRPFNFRSLDPERRSHAVQYVSHPEWPWQILRSKYPGKYEKAMVPEVSGDEWFHVRVVVERPWLIVSVNGVTTPCLVVKELSNHVHGFVGVWVGEGSGGSFANLRITRN